MKTLLASLALASTTLMVAAPAAQAVTTNLVFGTPTLDSGVGNQVGAVYRFANVTSNVDVLFEITGVSAEGQVTVVDGNEPFYDSSADNLVLTITRPVGSSEADTFANFKVTFVDTGTSNATIVNDVVLTFGDIDSHDNLAFADYIQFDPTQFSSIAAGGDLVLEAHGTETRYVYGFPGNSNVSTTSNEQIEVSVILGLDNVSGFNATWGYVGAGNFFDRSMLLDGSNELQIDAIPEPASAALLGLGGLALLARRRR